MSAALRFIGHIETPWGGATILVGRYPTGGAIALQLVVTADPSEPIATFSSNLVPSGANLAANEFCVKTWSENEDLVAPMYLTGLFEDTGKRVPSGHVASPVWRIKDAANVPPATERRATTNHSAAGSSTR